jgi:2-dehydro-3-deoxygluconokinase
MINFKSKTVRAMGEAMLEMAPVGEGLYRQGYAGDTFNTVWHMAQLLGDNAKAGFVTRIGIDAFSNRFAAEMEADGLDLTGVVRDRERQMGLYLIELEGSERSFHYWRKDSAARGLADDIPLLRGMFEHTGLIHLSGITLAIISPDARANLLSAMADSRQAGSVVSFDPNFRPGLWNSPAEARDAMSSMLTMTDIALPSFDDEATLWGDVSPGETITRFRDQGVREIVVKDGAGMVHFHAGEAEGRCDTPPVANAIDTTGAGDSFNAGYLSARLGGKDARQAIGIGQKLAAEVIQILGARAPKETVRRLSDFVAR